MATKTVYNAEKDYELQEIDFLSLIFATPTPLARPEDVVHVEAANPENKITKAELRDYTRFIAHIFRTKYGIGAQGPGRDVVVCISTGQILVPAAFYATVAAGGIYSSASSSCTHGELERQITQGGAVLLVTAPDCEIVARKAARAARLLAHRILVLDSTAGRRSLLDDQGLDLLRGDRAFFDWEVIRDPATLRSRPICLLYSSGTTGAPKGVRITHWNMSASAQIAVHGYRSFLQRQKARDASFGFEYRTLAHLPTAHIAGVQGYLMYPLMYGGTVFWMPKFDFSRFLRYNKQFRITSFFSVPPIFLLLANSPLVTDQFRTMRHAISGAAPMGAELTARAERVLGCTIAQVWGLTETTGAVTEQAWDDKDDTGSISTIMSNLKVRLVDEEENDVPEGTRGELLVQGPTITTGYWKNPEAATTAWTRCGAWFKTGDIAVRRNRLFYIIDRKKELIKYKGMQIAPAELEAQLLSHPMIQDAAVIGVPDKNNQDNEVPRAFVVADRSRVGEDEIQKYIRDRLASYKQLRGGVVYVAAIPKNPTGKILRRELREMTKSQRRAAKL